MSARTFNLEIDTEFARNEDELRLGIRRIGLDALSRVTAKTPVDKGLARNNWFVGIGEPGTQTTDETDPGIVGTPSAKAVARGSPVIASYSKEKGYPKISIYNNLPYINRLENGHSKTQAPAGMVALTLAELQVGL